jgi:acyl-CoA dehydrogenase
MSILGGELKRREKISARLGDVLSHLYLASAVLKRFHNDEYLADLPLVDWCCQQLFYECELALAGIISNFPYRVGQIFLKIILQPFGLTRNKPSDKLGHRLARLMVEPNETRNRLTRVVFIEALAICPVGRLEHAFNKLGAVDGLERKLANIVKTGTLKSLTLLEQINDAQQLGLLDSSEVSLLIDAEKLRQAVIAVDDFNDNQLRRENTN